MARLAAAFAARHQIARAMKVLTLDERRLIELAFFDGYTHAELTALLKLPLGTVKTRMRRALQKLRDAMS